MKKKIILLLLLPTIVQAQQIDSIQFIGADNDSLELVVHFTLEGVGVMPNTIEYEEDASNIKVNIFYTVTLPHPDCICQYKRTFRIKKDIYQKAIVSIWMLPVIGGTVENPEYPDDYSLWKSKEIDLSNIISIDNPTTSNKISIFPNPVQNVFYVNLGENRTANLEIYDTQGNLLLSKDIISEKEIDVSSLSSGLYAVLIDKKYIGNIIKK